MFKGKNPAKLYQIKNTSSNEAYRDDAMREGLKAGLQEYSQILPEETFIQKVEMTVKKSTIDMTNSRQAKLHLL